MRNESDFTKKSDNMYAFLAIFISVSGSEKGD